MASGVPDVSSDTTLWSGAFRIDRRFGTSGAAAFLLDWALITGSQAHADLGRRIVEDILAQVVSDGRGLFWRLSRYGFQGDGEWIYTGYFYGASGLGLILLQHHLALFGKYPRTRLPDDPFPRGPRSAGVAPG